MKPLATWSPCRRYRYTLRRHIGTLLSPGVGTIAFLLLNPSTATETKDDPTIRRCIDFGQRWGFAELVIINAYALRASNPKRLWTDEQGERHGIDPVGEGNDAAITEVVGEARRVVCGWGKHARLERVDRLAELLVPAREVVALRLNKDGSPEHPLYIPAAVEPFNFRRSA